ncbi:unnamed protein product [Lymnaea stagnalis]|uniref:Adenylyl cyclase-associated protein n=1 Tax=Lymnaea stagnalis TaxID=6523 RepID=A0AAV2HWB9_LYMST
MFCCCPQESDNYTVDRENQKNINNSTEARIQTGKGAVSSSNQNISTEANLDKSTISETKREKSPVVEQPKAHSKTTTAGNSSEPSKQQHISTSDVKTEELRDKPIDLTDIESKVVTEPQGLTGSLNINTNKVESNAKSVSVISVSQKSNNPNLVETQMPNIQALKVIKTDLDKIEKAISEAETKSNWDAKSAVPGLANQLKVLTSQVLASLASTGDMAGIELQAAVSRLEAVATRLESLAARSAVGGGGHSAGGDSDAVSPYVLAYDDLIAGPLSKYISLSNDVGGDVKAQAQLVKSAFDAQRSFLIVASKSKQPDQNTLIQLLKPSSERLQAVQDFRENNRKSEFFNHLSAIGESIAALGWVAIAPAPGPYVKEMSDAGTFYTNRVLKDFKEKDVKHVEWTRAWISTLTELQGYIKQFHTTGLSWNPQGGDAKSVKSSSSGPAPPAGGAPPPPPPPGPPPPPDMSGASKDDEGTAAKAALFAQLNKGEDVTKGLRKVTDDMKTHKNPTLRQGPAPFKPTPGVKPQTSPKPTPKSLAAPAKPPLIELQDKKWIVEYHKDNKNIVIDNTELKQSVYIFKCEGSVVQVKGKISSIVLDSCKKTAIVFDDLVSSIEFVNCQSVQAQVTGKVPTLSIDKTDGCLVYLSPSSLEVEIVTAKSSEMNILVPQADGDYKEFALPEQYKTKYDGKTMVTTISDSI